MTNLTNKIALVTGGSRGIGAAIAKRLAADGASVAITYTQGCRCRGTGGERYRTGRRQGHRAAGGRRRCQAVTAAVEKTVATFGGLDVLVNNAGTAIPKPFEETTLEEMDRVIDINLRGVFIATQAALKQLPSGGRIINIGSCVGERVMTPGLVAYAATKGAVKMFTQGLAREVGPRGITVNNIQPGPIDTDLNPAAGDWATPQIASHGAGALRPCRMISPRWWRSSPGRRPATSPAPVSPLMAAPTRKEQNHVDTCRKNRARYRRLARHWPGHGARAGPERRAGAGALQRAAAEAEAVVSEIRSLGGRAQAIAADLSAPDAPHKLAARVLEIVGGRLDILVANAGISKAASIEETSVEDFDRLFAVNVRAPFFLVQQLLPILGEGSSVVLLSSLAAHAAVGTLYAYAMTKGAIDTMVKHFAAALGPRGIRVNAVAPGVVETDMSNFARTDAGRDFTLGIQALKRIAQPDDIAGTIAFLASDEARWVTGDTIHVDGGSKL